MIKLVNDNTMSINGKELVLDGVTIRKYIETNELIIIRLTYEDKNSYWYTKGRTILALDHSGKELWRIEKAPDKYGASGYVNIHLIGKAGYDGCKEGDVIAHNEGRNYKVDISNGKITLLDDLGSRW